MKNNRKHSPAPSSRSIMLAGWIFLGVAITVAVVAIVVLLGQKEPELSPWEPTYPSNETVAPPQTGGTAGADGGTSVIIKRCLPRLGNVIAKSRSVSAAAPNANLVRDLLLCKSKGKFE